MCSDRSATASSGRCCARNLARREGRPSGASPPCPGLMRLLTALCARAVRGSCADGPAARGSTNGAPACIELPACAHRTRRPARSRLNLMPARAAAEPCNVPPLFEQAPRRPFHVVAAATHGGHSTDKSVLRMWVRACLCTCDRVCKQCCPTSRTASTRNLAHAPPHAYACMGVHDLPRVWAFVQKEIRMETPRWYRHAMSIYRCGMPMCH